ncbi:MAG TPA: hypothetical protein VJA82_05575 [Sediminibacterium sp.]|uniref:hypothetical protein n=1 Tax=Sediminibacterium sp. TaxID=1917865 RepID=UPI0008B6A0CF|nr:hypothetical protein [Sediminibacterium sp.]OHC85613.1 MAG: hypothetical protein A2472_07620 [Sphingobacteriia bacterium RIFOXYC2_FULL_35_18]OHC89278.1 MAG: hypothetical protein A2546_07050 [Sphingobacteriia bacterium RIFOXYD2_FULL_35_12]HLD52749.1 hypothetical protein [Sediminibacterium sp.]
MKFGKTIKLFLMDGDPNGRMSCELSNWSGKAYKIPRIKIMGSYDRKELETTGVYLLFGKDENENEQVYIGEAESILKRLNQQITQKEFWNEALVQNLDTSVISSPYFIVFIAAQVKANYKGFLTRDILLSDLVNIKGDVHHLFSRDYLKKAGYQRGKYNQIANYVYMQSETNIQVGNKAPAEYFGIIEQQILNQTPRDSGITTMSKLDANMKMNCIPPSIKTITHADFETFLAERRTLMANKIRDYYNSL